LHIAIKISLDEFTKRVENPEISPASLTGDNHLPGHEEARGILLKLKMHLQVVINQDHAITIIREMPKTELHIHLEGAVPLATLLQLIQRHGDSESEMTMDCLKSRFTYADFTDFIDAWVWKNTFIKDEKDFEEIAYQTLQQLSVQHVKYVEAFYSPGDYRRQGLSVEGITESLIAGKERALQEFGIRSELIVDLTRDHGPEVGIRRIDEVTPYLGKGVIGIGLGGSEKEYPADPYEFAYNEAKQRGFRLTVHAGEAAGANSIWAAIKKLQAERIGHGVRLKEDPQLMRFLQQSQIPLEMCVGSNLSTKVVESLSSHPIKEYFDNGLMVTVNSDDPTMFNTSITQEYELLVKKLGFTLADIQQLMLNGIHSSFLTDEEKQQMKEDFNKEWLRLMDTSI